jgi:hypothetical protein|eukprot:jgi/Chrpa1/17120/Chrysochromulina_OHIO_Genome00022275-RA
MFAPIFAALVLVPPTPASVSSQPVSLPALERVRSLVAAEAPRSDGALALAVKELVEEASLPALIDWKQVAGTWRVVNAPHIDTLSSVLFTKFSPIEYVLGPSGEIASYVRYSGLPGTGWLCTDGTIENVADSGRPTVKVVWDRIWWVPSGTTSHPAFEDGAFSPLIQALGRLGFIEDLSVFPVRFVQDDVAVFDFQSFTVTAQRQVT